MSYHSRALKAHDRRFARVFEKLGYGRKDMQAEPEAPVEVDEITILREEYEAVIGRRPFYGWDGETLKTKIEEARG